MIVPSASLFYTPVETIGTIVSSVLRLIAMNTEKKTPSIGVYILPNLITTAALFSGFYAIIAAMNGRFEVAAVAVFIAMILDGADGRVARWTNTTSEFGAQYDSLADLVLEHFPQQILNKTCTLTNWLRRPLGKPQIEYAALDAVVCLLVYQKLNVNN